MGIQLGKMNWKIILTNREIEQQWELFTMQMYTIQDKSIPLKKYNPAEKRNNVED